MDSLTILRAHVLDLEPAASVEEALDLWNRVERAKSLLREVSRDMEAQFLAWLQTQPGQSVECGDLRYYVGSKKTVKCIDTIAALNAVVDAAGMDPDAIGGCLAAQPFRFGATKKLIGEAVYAALFDETVEPDLMTGKPRRVVKVVDQRFLDGERGSGRDKAAELAAMAVSS